MLDIEKVVRRINNGESQSSIAEELGMHESTLRAKILQAGYRRIYIKGEDEFNEINRKLDEIFDSLADYEILKLVKLILLEKLKGK